jgi:hypothetical protein
MHGRGNSKENVVAVGLIILAPVTGIDGYGDVVGVASVGIKCGVSVPGLSEREVETYSLL